ncbi:SDR family NAD(P)-dependent oxidoreductase [Woeseia oceani]|uniref:3-hydroxy-2-methylbutyryl-CoA dehydrogenase n=1 Tax=Woeseia oceani TaxID=1548547 RepID=A0A193LEA0_9GAMM|nr:SDR family NAD(P)-dependent oxidoreductase [Woeseia oceani]ANO50793.1 3-hydroxy-2-methylbutyryl-CoA dehydrogenase [Woeseia oceani]
MELSSAKAIVSGGASGLGLATAERVIAAGGQVVLLDINDKLGPDSAAALGERAHFIRTDVADEASVQDAMSQAAKLMGGITLAVNCAGILLPARVLGRDGPLPAESFARSVTINLVGSFILAKEAANIMQHNEPTADGERGLIVNTASVAAFEGQIGQAGYSASKGGVVGMMLPLAREFARLGIRVNTIAPGIFLTPMMAGLPDEVQQSLGAQVPFPPRMGRPDEYADLVVAIYGNTMINGETIRLDGAIRMQPK